MEFNQVFKAPSIPKLSKKNISSPMIRGAIKPNLRVTRFSGFQFFKPSAPKATEISEKISGVENNQQEQKTIKSQLILADSLSETNRILVEIQKQLTLDFSNRIAEQKEELKKIRSAKEKKKIADKEASVESIKKIGDVLTKPLGLITTPIKSIFQKIFEFFSTLLTGLVLNNVFNWLSKKENREKIYTFFKFLTDNWRTLAAIIVGGLAIKALYKIIRLVQTVKGILRFLRILPQKPGKPGPTTVTGDKTKGGIFRTGEGARRGITTEKTGLLRQTYDRYDPNSRPGSGMQEIYKRTKSPLGKTLQTVEVLTAKAGSDILKKIGLGPGAKGILGFLRPIFKRIPIFGGLMDFALSLALGEPIGRAAAKSIGAMLGGALGSFIPIPGVGTVAGGILGDLAAGAIYDAIVGKGKQEDQKVEKKELGGKLKGPSHAAGGIPASVGGRRLELEGGEYLVRKSEVPRFEPILTDINENGGRMWESFTQGIKKQQNVNASMMFNVREFDSILTEYKKIVEDEKKRLEEKKRKQSGGGSPGAPAAPPPAPSLPPSQEDATTPGSGSTAATPTTPQSNTPQSPATPPTSQANTGPVNPQSNAILDNLWGRKPGTTAQMQANAKNGIMPADTAADSAKIARMISPISPNPKTTPENLSPAPSSSGITVLPPIVKNSPPPKVEMPTFNEGRQSLPSILPFDVNNEYLEKSLLEYSINVELFVGR